MAVKVREAVVIPIYFETSDEESAKEKSKEIIRFIEEYGGFLYSGFRAMPKEGYTIEIAFVNVEMYRKYKEAEKPW